MLYAFTDESYSSGFYFQGALIVGEDELSELENIVGEILIFASKYGVAAGVEIHGHSIMNSAHGWESLDRKFGVKIRILREIFTGIANTNSQLIVAGIFAKPLNFHVASTRHRHIHTHDLLLGMINHYAASLNQEVSVYSCLYIFHRISSLGGESKSSHHELKALWAIVLRLIHEDFKPMIIGLESTEGSQ